MRVSTDEQDLGMKVQLERIRGYAKLYDLELVGIGKDHGVSAKTLDRPGLVQVFRALRAGKADGILVAKLDRLTRSVRDLGFLLDTYFCEGKYVLMSVGENIDTRTAVGRLILNVLGSVSQWERETIGERTKAALAIKKKKGERVGTVPYGYEVVPGSKRLVENPQEQAVIRECRKLRAAGWSIRQIVVRLQMKKTRGRKGRLLGVSQVHRMVRMVKGGVAK